MTRKEQKVLAIKELGYKCTKKRGIDNAKDILTFVCQTYNIIIKHNNSWVEYWHKYSDAPEPTCFRSTFGKINYWNEVFDICDYIREDILDFANSKEWPYFRLLPINL